ncbi:MAG: hypothetical protein KGY76_01740 [Candidatus Thermoplasmatota archaeon]|nr:hypothetical protein [Candidatus Thermoplasmatota archaeon]
MVGDLELIGLFAVYYLIFPLGLIYLAWEIWKKKDYIEGERGFDRDIEGSTSSHMEDDVKKLKKLQVILVVFLIIFLPVTNVLSSSLTDIYMDKDQKVVSAFGASISMHPVNRQIGPSFDTQSVIEKMEDSEKTWYLDDIRAQIDLEGLTSIPGRLAVYKMSRPMAESNIVITYAYLSPLPIIRVFGFIIFEGSEEYGDGAELWEDETIVYPMNPAGGDPF